MKLDLYAPVEYHRLTPGQRETLCNGCGAKGICGWIVPDTLYGLDISEACNIHDFMYHLGMTINDKIRADRVFFNNMLRIIDKKSRWSFLAKLRARRAKTYFYFVSEFGGPAFWLGKNAPEKLGLVNKHT